MCTTITQNLLHARRGGWPLYFLGRAGSRFSNPHFLFADKTWNGHFDQQKRREERHWESSSMVLVMAWFFKSKIRFLSSKSFGYKIWMYKILWRLENDVYTTKSRKRLILFAKVLAHFRSKEQADSPLTIHRFLAPQSNTYYDINITKLCLDNTSVA